jgi:peptide/nickel transport system substrate-binding protein
VKEISRREFLRVTTLAAAGVAAAACARAAEPTTAPEATKAPATQPTNTPVPVVEEEAKEAPMLAEMVAAGSLPAMEERMPANPNVMPVMEEIGKYGGIIRRGFKGVFDRWGPTKHNDRGLCWYNKDLVMQPRIAESWEINDDATEWTFHLRKGMKWHNGEPFDSDAQVVL